MSEIDADQCHFVMPFTRMAKKLKRASSLRQPVKG